MQRTFLSVSLCLFSTLAFASTARLACSGTKIERLLPSGSEERLHFDFVVEATFLNGTKLFELSGPDFDVAVGNVALNSDGVKTLKQEDLSDATHWDLSSTTLYSKQNAYVEVQLRIDRVTGHLKFLEQKTISSLNGSITTTVDATCEKISAEKTKF